jgi:hypothetical protein
MAVMVAVAARGAVVVLVSVGVIPGVVVGVACGAAVS